MISACHCQNTGQQIDEGDINAVERLPITGLRLGDVDDNDEWIYFTLGPLICQKGKQMMMITMMMMMTLKMMIMVTMMMS